LKALLTAKRACIAFALLSCVNVLETYGQAEGPLKLTQTIPLPGVEGRIDHLAVDLAGHRLFLCALGNDTLEIIDVEKGVRVHSITGLGAPQGVAYIPELNRLLVANDQEGMCNFYDGKSLTLAGRVKFGDDADNVRYDSVARRIYVGFGGGLGILDASNGRRIGTIELSGHPEAFVLEKKGPRIFVNVPGAREVAVVNRDKGAVISRWKTDWAFANYPLAFDETNRRLFVGCRLPAKIVVLNSDSGAVVTSFKIDGDADDVFYDATRHRLYAICGDGTIDVIDQVDRDTYKTSARMPTAAGARTGLFVPERHALFVAAPQLGTQGAEILRYQVN
jgi:DNA-binding beta-propeller fold protein YncE